MILRHQDRLENLTQTKPLKMGGIEIAISAFKYSNKKREKKTELNLKKQKLFVSYATMNLLDS